MLLWCTEQFQIISLHKSFDLKSYIDHKMCTFCHKITVNRNVTKRSFCQEKRNNFFFLSVFVKFIKYMKLSNLRPFNSVNLMPSVFCVKRVKCQFIHKHKSLNYHILNIIFTFEHEPCRCNRKETHTHSEYNINMHIWHEFPCIFFLNSKSATGLNFMLHVGCR